MESSILPAAFPLIAAKRPKASSPCAALRVTRVKANPRAIVRFRSSTDYADFQNPNSLKSAGIKGAKKSVNPHCAARKRDSLKPQENLVGGGGI